jgi:hypothetical protein
LAEETGAKFPDRPEFADMARQLKILLDAMSGDPNALPDVIPQ